MGQKQDELMHSFVVDRYPEMRRAAYLMCGDWQLSEKLVKATLAKIVAGRRRRAHNLDPLARRRLMSAFRTGWRGPFRRREHLFHSLADSPDAPPRRSGGLDPLVKVSVLAALHQLPPRRRAVVVLHHWERLTLRETARTLKITVRAARAHSVAGLAVLRAVAGDLLGEPADPADSGSTDADPAGADLSGSDLLDPDLDGVHALRSVAADSEPADTLATGGRR
jgi:DNA-directed RNA polymerase specialized sigma24 family protein